jgi:hypothetical protein
MPLGLRLSAHMLMQVIARGLFFVEGLGISWVIAALRRASISSVPRSVRVKWSLSSIDIESGSLEDISALSVDNKQLVRKSLLGNCIFLSPFFYSR